MYFGYVDKGGAAPQERHKWTNRLEGKGIHWQQDNDIEVLEFYLSTIYSNFFDLTRFGGELTVCAPTDYIMVNDHQFIYSRVESEFSGTMSTQLIDLFDLTQKGVRLGINDKDAARVLHVHGQGQAGRPDRHLRGVRQQRRDARARPAARVSPARNLRR